MAAHHGKRARRMSIDTNILSVTNLMTIKSAIDNELETATETTKQMELLMESTNLKVIISHRRGK